MTKSIFRGKFITLNDIIVEEGQQEIIEISIQPRKRLTK